jgi:hypothetical protein
MGRRPRHDRGRIPAKRISPSGRPPSCKRSGTRVLPLSCGCSMRGRWGLRDAAPGRKIGRVLPRGGASRGRRCPRKPYVFGLGFLAIPVQAEFSWPRLRINAARAYQTAYREDGNVRREDCRGGCAKAIRCNGSILTGLSCSSGTVFEVGPAIPRPPGSFEV